MAKENTFMGVIIWVTGILVSLAVGFGMTSKTLTIPFLSAGNYVITVIAGWIVVLGAIISIIMALFGK